MEGRKEGRKERSPELLRKKVAGVREERERKEKGENKRQGAPHKNWNGTGMSEGR
jgi:hypothetical protein